MKVPSYVVFSSLAALCFAICNILSKLVIKHSIKSANSLMAYFLLSLVVFSFFLLPFTSKTIPELRVLGQLFVGISTLVVGTIFLYKGMALVDATTFSPLFQIQAVIIALLAFLFLGERFPLNNYLWMGVVFGGAFMVSVDESLSIKAFFTRGIFLIILTQVFHAVSNLYFGFSLKALSHIDMQFWAYFLSIIIFIIYYLVARPKLNDEVKKIIPYAVTVFIQCIGAFFLFKSFTLNVTISSVIALMSSPIVFVISLVLSHFRPNLLEHHTVKVYLLRFLGIAVILLGVVRLSMG